MPKLHDRPEQLPLRLFVDVSVQTQALSCSAKKKEATSKGGAMPTPQAASEHDMSVYRQISGNYFRSRQKA